MAITIQIGLCTEDPRKLDKRPNFAASNPVQITADIKDSCSLTNPDLIVIGSFANLSRYNYVYISAWGRYYYVSDMVAMPGSRVSIRCTVDVLTSFCDEIAALRGNIKRAESDTLRNSMIYDSGLTPQSNRQCQTIKFNRTPFAVNPADTIYLLTVMGGTNTGGGSAQ